MRLIRRWPKFHRRVVVTRRCYSRVYWYCWEFKEEFVNEVFGPSLEKEEDPHAHLPIYYNVYLFVRAIPRGVKCYFEDIRSDYAKWAAFRDNSQLGFKNFSKEIREIHSDNKSSYRLWFSVTVKLFRDSINQFLKGYNEAMNGKPFPSEEKLDGKYEGESIKEKNGRKE